MLKYLLSRVAQSALTLVGIAFVTFLLMHAVPGGPFESLAGERAVSPDFVRQQEAYYGLNDPVPLQFLHYLGNLLRGDLGLSFSLRGQAVSELVIDGLRPSLLLGSMAFALVLGVGLPVGVLGAISRGRRWDHAGLALTTLLGAIPSFVLAFVLLLVFAVWLDVFDVRLGKGFGDSVGSLPNGVLPAIALAAPAIALLSRHVRSAMIEVLHADYIRTAHAKGLRARSVYTRHALRNALLPVLTVSGPLLADLVMGSVVIESIFGLPGLGSMFVNAIGARDYGVIMATTLVYASLIVGLNLLVDLAYPLLDPRVRLAR